MTSQMLRRRTLLPRGRSSIQGPYSLQSSITTVFEQTLSELRPHYLCIYLYELAGVFSAFYNANKVIVDDKPTMAKRLVLCSRTLGILEAGLRLLGIEPLEKM